MRHVAPLCQLVVQGVSHRCGENLGGSLRNLRDHTAVAAAGTGTAARCVCRGAPRLALAAGPVGGVRGEPDSCRRRARR